MHLLLELKVEGFSDLTDCCFVEGNHCLLLSLFENLLQFCFEHWALVRELVIEKLLEDLVRVLCSFLTLILADVAPRWLNRWYGASVDGVDIRFSQVIEHLSVKGLAVKLFGLNTVHDLAAQGVNLFNEFRSKCLERDVRQILQLIFLCQGPNHGATVALFEKWFQQASNSVFLVNCFAETLLSLKSLFQVVLWGDWLRILVYELEGEVAHHPHERGEVLRILFRVRVIVTATGLNLYILCQIYHKT